MDNNEWNERYRASTVWSGRPNDALVAHIELPSAGPGHGLGGKPTTPTAIDLGCGEGADALWLARQGWSVVGVDWAGLALRRAQAAAADGGLDARFVEGDITDHRFLAGLSPCGTFDLVTVGFVHPEPQERERTFAPLPGLVSPGGRLFLLAHDPDHGEQGLPGPPPHRQLSPAMIVELLDLPDDFTVEVCDVQRRRDDAGQISAVDSVVVVSRAAA